MGCCPVKIVASLFITWHLWAALRSPPTQHPILRYAQRDSILPHSPSSYWRWVWAVVGCLVVLASILAPIPTLPILLAALLVIPLGLFVFSGTVLGCIWGGRISTILAHIRHSQQYELLSLTPAGDFGTTWLVSAGVVHNNNWLNTVYRIVRGLALALGVLISLVILMGALAAISEAWGQGDEDISYYWDLLGTVLLPLLFVVGMWFDHVQSILVAVLVGIAFSKHSRDSALVRWLVPLCYLIIQILSYAALYIIYAAANAVFTAWLDGTMLRTLLVALTMLCGLFFLRDILLSLLWRWLDSRYTETIALTTKKQAQLVAVPE